jgi:hypothetical protein
MFPPVIVQINTSRVKVDGVVYLWVIVYERVWRSLTLVLLNYRVRTALKSP